MTEIVGWQMREPGAALEPVRRPVPLLAPDEVLVRVAGCGLCHTDVGFLFEGVRTRRPPPLILGHEVSGIVEDAGVRAPIRGDDRQTHHHRFERHTAPGLTPARRYHAVRRAVKARHLQDRNLRREQIDARQLLRSEVQRP